MESLYLLIPLSVLLLLGGVAVYFWAVKSGQYEDLDQEGERILFEEELFEDEPEPEEQECDNSSQQE